jgi:hypothetical protein
MKLPAGHVAGVGVHKATAYGGFGQQMLEKMGWSKGQGLGKEKHGMKEAIEVKKKEDSLGVSLKAALDVDQGHKADNSPTAAATPIAVAVAVAAAVFGVLS